MSRTVSRPLAGAVLLLGGLTTAFTLPEERLKDADHKKLGKAIAEYFEASTEEDGIAEALAEVKENLDKISKKVKGEDPLAFVEDLERAVFYANNYPKQKVRKGKGKVEAWDVEDPYFGELPLVLHAPKSYNATKGPYSLILSLPDEGQTPLEHIQQDWNDADLLGKAIVVSFEMPEDVALWDQIGNAETPGGLGLVMASFGKLTKMFAVDMDRVFLSGRGAGVPAALSIAAQYPHCFAGVVGRAGDPADLPATNFVNTATFFAGGGAGATAFQENIKELGVDNSTISSEASQADIWGWMEQTRRDPMPARVIFSPTSRASTSYWLQIQGFDPESARIEATADRESNTITITSKGVSTVNLFFNDLLVDMDRPVKVIANGTTHEDLIPRNFQTMLANAYNKGDTGRVFTATFTYNITEGGDGTR